MKWSLFFIQKVLELKTNTLNEKSTFELRLNLGNIIIVGWTCNTVHDITTSRSLHRDDNVIVFQNMHF